MIEFLKTIAREAGQIALEAQLNKQSLDIEYKNEKDLVTAIDKKVEDFLVEKISTAYPDHAIFGEETGKHESESEYCWVIDPIDGTTSFVHDQPFYAVSIGLNCNDETIAGVVFAPKLDEFFFAEKGKGAFLNDQAISPSDRDKLINCVLTTGFGCLRAGHEPNNLKPFALVAPMVRGVRRFGSAAIDLCYVASGKADGYWELDLQPYDYMAGKLIAEEAGAQVSLVPRKGYETEAVIAANEYIYDELYDMIFQEI